MLCAEALEAGRIQATATATESDPELVVVFDLAGTVERFIRAVRDIEGLEFLAEVDDEPYDADEDFYLVDREGQPVDRQVPETMYMVMSNARAVAELIRLFELWQADPTVPFDRGVNPLKTAFALMRAVRRWGPDDRIRETGLLQAWRDDLSVAGTQRMRVEIELWFRSDDDRRGLAEAEVRRLVQAGGGTVITSAVLPDIEYHAVLADIPRAQVQTVLGEGAEAIELLALGLDHVRRSCSSHDGPSARPGP